MTVRRVLNRWLALVALGLSMSPGGCFLLPPQLLGVSTTDTISLGVMAPASGTNAEKGESVYNGVLLAIEQVNAAGGVLGKPLAMVKADDQSDASKAPGKAARLLGQGIVAIVGDVQSGVTKAVLLQQAKPAGCVMVSPGSTSPDYSNPAKIDTGGYFFRTVPNDSLQGKVIAQRANSLGYKKLGIINVYNTYGNGLAGVLKSTFEALPGHTTIVATYSEEPTPHPSYSQEIAPILAAQPDAIALIGYPGGGSQIVKDWISSNQLPSVPWLFSEALKADSFVANVSNPQRLEGLTGTTPYSGGDNYNHFANDYVARFKISPGPYAVNAYDAAVVIALAMQKGGAATRSAVKDNLRNVVGGSGTAITPGADGVKAGLTALKAGQDVAYQGASEPLGFDSHGDVTTGIYAVWQIKGGAIQSTSQILKP